MSSEPTPQAGVDSDAEVPSPDVIRRVADALEADETGETPAITFTPDEGTGSPLLPRRD